MIEIPKELNIPTQDFIAFAACNSKATRSFYALKDKILKVFGNENDYDLQHITKKCHTCNGTGLYYSDSRCRRCKNGVWAKYDVVLKRYLLNGSCFHIPLGRLEGNRLKIFDGIDWHDEFEDYGITKWKYQPFEGIFKNTITGIIKHEYPTNLNTYWLCWYLLYKYDIDTFNCDAKVFLGCNFSKDEFQLRNYMWLTSKHPLEALAKYYKCEDTAKQFEF